jgi:hypothetical protein
MCIHRSVSLLIEPSHGFDQLSLALGFFLQFHKVCAAAVRRGQSGASYSSNRLNLDIEVKPER